MTDDEIIEVVRAHKEGKKVQFKYKPTEDSDYEWFDVDHTRIWFFDKYDYRVALEPRKPREWWIIPNPNYYVDVASRTKDDGRFHNYTQSEAIHVREVLE